MGFSGSGFTTVQSVQEYLAGRWSTVAPNDLVTQLDTALNSLGANGSTVLANFFAKYGEAAHLPQNLDDFVSALISSVPSSLGFTNAVQGAQLKATIRETIKNNLSLENAGFDQKVIAQALADPSLAPYSATFYQDVYDKAFDKFLNEFDYSGPTVAGALPTVTAGLAHVNTAYFGGRFSDFFFKFASVANPTHSSVNFEDIYEAFFGTGNPNFTAFLANYIKNTMDPSSGTPAPFLPNENIGDWMMKVQESYSLSLSGAPAPLTSSVGDSVKKVAIIDIVIQLIIKLIGTLQKVAAVQSDRLRILTSWQAAYTNLQSQVPTFTEGDGTIFGRSDLTSKEDAQKARDQANAFNQAMTETIRSRRTVIEDDAKVQQSNINQSLNSSNDQASTASALIQTLSTLLAAIYRG